MCGLITFAGKLYHDKMSIEERHRHRYEVNPEYVKELEKAGMEFVGHSIDNTRMEVLELSGVEACVFYCCLFCLLFFPASISLPPSLLFLSFHSVILVFCSQITPTLLGYNTTQNT